MNRAPFVAGLFIASLLGSCGRSASTPPSLDGTFIAHPGLGSSITLELQQQGSSITGQGSFTREAGAPGSLTLSGTSQAAGQINLALIFDDQQTASFTGMLSGADLSGSYTVGGSTTWLVFIKQAGSQSDG